MEYYSVKLVKLPILIGKEYKEDKYHTMFEYPSKIKDIDKVLGVAKNGDQPHKLFLVQFWDDEGGSIDKLKLRYSHITHCGDK